MTAPIMPRRPLPSISTIVPLVFASLMAFGAQAGAQVANPAPDSGRPALMQSVPVPLAPSKATAASTDPPPVLTLDTAIELLSLPDRIRGYGPVKEKAVQDAKARYAQLAAEYPDFAVGR